MNKQNKKALAGRTGRVVAFGTGVLVLVWWMLFAPPCFFAKSKSGVAQAQMSGPAAADEVPPRARKRAGIRRGFCINSLIRRY